MIKIFNSLLPKVFEFARIANALVAADYIILHSKAPSRSLRYEMSNPVLCTSHLRIVGISLSSNDKVAHECKRGGGVVIRHGVARAEDVVVGEAPLGKKRKRGQLGAC